jgi:hypothetical protein
MDLCGEDARAHPSTPVKTEQQDQPAGSVTDASGQEGDAGLVDVMSNLKIDLQAFEENHSRPKRSAENWTVEGRTCCFELRLKFIMHQGLLLSAI